MILGIDVSSYLEQIRLSHPSFKKEGKIVDPFLIFKNNGVSHIRVRIWDNPYDENGNPYYAGTCDLTNFINLYRELKKYGFKYLVDLHYSDFWTDPGKQFLPERWKNLSFDELVNEVYKYTFETLSVIKEEGVDVTHIQIGNEITHGFLWPFGEIKEGGKERKEPFKRLSLLLKSGIKAAKEVYPSASIIIHLERSYDKYCYDEFVNELTENGVVFDILGSSYYPLWHHNFEEYFSNQENIKNKYHLKLMNCELGFPFTKEDYLKDAKENHMLINSVNGLELEKILPYPVSKKGQADFIRDFIKEAKKHDFEGVFYWEPLWIPGEGNFWTSDAAQKYQHDANDKEYRSDYANQCLFDYDGNMNPAVEEFKL